MAVSIKLSMCIFYDSAILCLDVYPRKYFTQLPWRLLTIYSWANSWGWEIKMLWISINRVKLWYSHVRKYYSAMKNVSGAAYQYNKSKSIKYFYLICEKIQKLERTAWYKSQKHIIKIGTFILVTILNYCWP